MHRYTGHDHRTYPYARIGGGAGVVHAVPGLEIEFDEPPTDGLWEEVAPEPAPEPAPPEKTAPKRAHPKVQE